MKSLHFSGHNHGRERDARSLAAEGRPPKDWTPLSTPPTPRPAAEISFVVANERPESASAMAGGMNLRAINQPRRPVRKSICKCEETAIPLHRSHEFHESIEFSDFIEELLDAELPALLPVKVIGHRRQHHDSAGLRSETAQDLNSIQFRQVNVQSQDIRFQSVGSANGLPAVLGLPHHFQAREAAQQIRQILAHQRRVFGDQHAQATAALSCFSLLHAPSSAIAAPGRRPARLI
ncbi:MAG TPA: hypothetical protein VFV81_06280 [Verrucomicrobiae bacterium]|nr:hypothetical protein [Verrucomicrobiae bacterium]